MKVYHQVRDLIILVLIALVVISSYQACNNGENPTSPTYSSSPTESSSSGTSGDCPNGRSGAVCNDGTTSTATGSGACSHHGGVKYWLCN